MYKHNLLPGLMSLLFGTLCSPLFGTNLVVNGSFELSNFLVNSQFGAGYGGQGVTGWQGNGASAYYIYFSPITATTVSALNQWNSTSEELPATFTGGSPNGGNFVAIDGDPTLPGSLTQTINGLTAGAKYNLTFNWAATELMSRSGATTEAVKVTLGATRTHPLPNPLPPTPSRAGSRKASSLPLALAANCCPSLHLGPLPGCPQSCCWMAYL